jgi:3-oxoacyl-[acyl-carrier protein] reductase
MPAMPERRVLVTGSSRGIGRAIAARLANDGWSVAVHYGSERVDAEKVRKSLGARCSGIYEADLSKPAMATKLFADVVKDGPVHAVVNNAGVYMPLDFLATGDAAFAANLHRTFAINFESPALLIRAAGKYFAKHGGGKIVNVASRVGFKGEGGAALYAASKAALINLTRSLAVEMASKHIGIYGIAPGWVETAMVREGMQQRKKEIIDSIPMGRIATPEDCAAAASFLLSDDASYLSGIVIDINGASYFH